MPGLHYLDNSPAQVAGNSLGGLAGQLPYLRVQAERLRQQRALDQARNILYGAQAGRAQAETDRAKAQTHDIENKTETAKATSAALRASGDAAAGLYLDQRPAFMANGPTLAGQADKHAADYIRGTTVAAGNNPQRAQQAIQGTIANLAAGVANNPNLAAAILTKSRLQQNIPANNVSLNAMTGQTTPGAVNVPAAGTVQMPGQAPVLGQQRMGNYRPLDQAQALERGKYIGQIIAKDPGISPEDLASAVKMLDQSFQSKAPSPAGPAAQSLGGQAPLPPSATPGLPPQAQGGIPHPTQRQIGDVIKTPKGTFKWAGDGWDPVNQPAQ